MKGENSTVDSLSQWTKSAGPNFHRYIKKKRERKRRIDEDDSYFINGYFINGYGSTTWAITLAPRKVNQIIDPHQLVVSIPMQISVCVWECVYVCENLYFELYYFESAVNSLQLWRWLYMDEIVYS